MSKHSTISLVAAIACLAVLMPSTASAQSVPTELKESLYQEFLDQMPWEGAKISSFEVKLKGRGRVRNWEALKLVPGRWRSGKMRAKVSMGGGRARWAEIRYEVQVPVWKLSCDVARGEQVGRCVEQGWESPSKLYRDAWPGAKALEQDFVSSRRLSMGQTLRRSMVKRPVWVERGQVVELLVRRGAVEIRDRGASIQSGRAGDVIRVKSASTGKVLDVVVRGRGKVEVL